MTTRYKPDEPVPAGPSREAVEAAITVHLREHRPTEASVEGCRFCIERNAHRLSRPSAPPPPSDGDGSWASGYRALDKMGRGE